MRVADFDFDLPNERIALRPMVPREAAKLLQVGHALTDCHVGDLPRLLRAGDCLVFNNTKVIPAALQGKRIGRHGTTPKIEMLLHQRVDGVTWTAFAKPAKKLVKGDAVDFSGLVARVADKGEAGEITFTFEIGSATELDAAIMQIGRVPLPPYIESQRPQDAQDAIDYQSVFAEKSGAVAAPTASLHFTHELMQRLQDVGVTHEFVTLHVGAGTFLPVKAEDTQDHKMHSEWGDVTASTAARLRETRQNGGRIIPVGTTSLRLLETSKLHAFTGNTNIFITPGYRFNAVDGLITNFHLPRSTLFMLVSAFAGVEKMRAAYAHAIDQNYRFYSYGDASLLWPAA
jgi:S-adenosylmethionine:tRNA ribosyltransferase-isomerase